MDVSVDMYIYNEKELLDAFATKGVGMEFSLTEILSEFGMLIDGEYIIINNEFWEDFNPFYELLNLLDEVYGEDLRRIFYDVPRAEGKTSVDPDGIREKLGLKGKT